MNLHKLSQRGFLSLHILLPAVIAIVVIGGVGSYLLTQSHAATPPPTGTGGTAPGVRVPPSWQVVKSQTGTYTVYVNKYFYATKAATTLEYGKPHRICVTGRSTGSSSALATNPTAFGGIIKLTSKSATYCTKTYQINDPYPNDNYLSDSNLITPTFFVNSGYPNAILTNISFQVYK